MQFDSLAELEGFWSAIPQQQHKVGRIKKRVKLSMSVIRRSGSGRRRSKQSGVGRTLHMHARTRRAMSAGQPVLSHIHFLQAWGQRMQQYIVHGSPQWHVYRCLPAFPDGTPAAGDSAAALGSRGSSSSSSRSRGRPAVAASSSATLVMPSDEELGKYAEAADGAAPLPSTKQQTASGLSIVGAEEVQQVLDWKGEPMQVRPGDKLPGVKFL